MKPAAIEVVDLAVSFDSARVLDGVSFTTAAGEVTVIAGGSGEGKTVLLKTIIGLQEAEAGRVLLFGRDTAAFSVRDWEQARREVAIVFQGNALFDSLTVWENVGFFLLRNTRQPERLVRARATEMLALVGLEGVEDLPPRALSGGMQKRVALARTLIFEPRVILYDEPTVGLDPATAETIEDLVTSLERKLGSTALVVTHDQHFTFRVARHIGLLDDGRLRTFGTPGEIRASGDPRVRAFFRLDAPAPGAKNPS